MKECFRLSVSKDGRSILTMFFHPMIPACDNMAIAPTIAIWMRYRLPYVTLQGIEMAVYSSRILPEKC